MNGRAPEDQRARRRWRRLLAVAAIGIGGLLTVTALVIAFLDFGVFKSRIETAATRILGRELRIDGELHIELGRQVVIEAGGIRLAGDMAGSEPALRVGQAYIVIDAASLLGTTLSIPVIDVTALRAEWTSYEDGSSNWPALVKSGDARRPPAEGLPVLIGRLTISDARVRVVDPALERPLEARLERVVHEVVDDRWRSSLIGTINDTRIDVNSDIGPRSGALRGQPVDFDIAGNLGELDIDARGELNDLRKPTRPVVDLDVRGPSAEYLLERLNLPVVTRGPLSLDVDLDADPQQMTISASGRFGEFELDTSGWVSNLSSLERFEVSGSVHGPDLQRVGALMSVPQLPAVPFDFDGRVVRGDDGIRFDNIGLDIGEARFSLNGRLPQLSPLVAENLRLTANGPDIDRFRALLGIRGILSGAFQLDASIDRSASGETVLAAEAQVGDIKEQLTAQISQHPRFHGTRIETYVSGPDARIISDGLGIEGIPSEPFEVTASAEYLGERVDVGSFSARLGQLQAEGRGVLRHTSRPVASEWSVEIQMPDLGETLAGFGIEDLPGWNTRAMATLSQSGGRIRLSDIDAESGPASIVGEVTVERRAGQIDAVDADLRVRGNDLSALHEDPRVKAAISGPVDARFSGRYKDTRLTIRQFGLELEGLSAEARGVVDHLPGLEATSLDFEVSIESLSALSANDSAPLPDLPFRISGKLLGEPDSVSVNDARISVADSVLDADLRYEPGDVPDYTLRLRSDRLDLRPFISNGRPESEPGPSESNADRLIPDTDIPVDWMSTNRSSIDIDVAELVTKAAELKELVLSARVGDGSASVRQFHVKGKRGELDIAMNYAPVGGTYRFDATLGGNGLVLAPAGEALDVAQARPVFDLESSFNAEGTNLRALAATVNGHFVLDGGRGVIPESSSWFRDLIFGDFVYQVLGILNPVAKRDHRLRFQCIAVMVNAENGVLSGKPMLVAQTRNANSFANGRINLDNEKIDFEIEMRQRRGLGFSLGDIINPYTRIAGTLAAPRVALDEEGVLIEGGAAAATGGLTVVAKALRNRLFQAKDPCGDALAEFNAKRNKSLGQ